MLNTISLVAVHWNYLLSMGMLNVNPACQKNSTLSSSQNIHIYSVSLHHLHTLKYRASLSDTFQTTHSHNSILLIHTNALDAHFNSLNTHTQLQHIDSCVMELWDCWLTFYDTWFDNWTAEWKGNCSSDNEECVWVYTHKMVLCTSTLQFVFVCEKDESVSLYIDVCAFGGEFCLWWGARPRGPRPIFSGLK